MSALNSKPKTRKFMNIGGVVKLNSEEISMYSVNNYQNLFTMPSIFSDFNSVHQQTEPKESNIVTECFTEEECKPYYITDIIENDKGSLVSSTNCSFVQDEVRYFCSLGTGESESSFLDKDFIRVFCLNDLKHSESMSRVNRAENEDGSCNSGSSSVVSSRVETRAFKRENLFRCSSGSNTEGSISSRENKTSSADFADVSSSETDDSDTSNNGLEGLKQLDINLDWEVPLLHRFPSYIYSPISQKEKNSLKRKGAVIETTSFTPKEDQILKKNWEKFQQVYKITDPSLFWKPLLCSPKQRILFVQFLARGLTNRTLSSVFLQFKNIYSEEEKKGPFSKKEDEMIMHFVSNNGIRFTMLSPQMRRNPSILSKRWRKLKKINNINDDRGKSRFSKEEDELIKGFIAKYGNKFAVLSRRMNRDRKALLRRWTKLKKANKS